MMLIQQMMRGIQALLYMIQKIKAVFGLETKNYDYLVKD